MRTKILTLIWLLPCLAMAHGDTTWAEYMAPIFYKNCTQCHHPGGLAPFSLMDYSDAYNYRQSIFLSTRDKRMPPWPPDAAYSQFAHQRVLTAQEISAIQDWVADGAPQGDLSKAPPKPVYSSSGFIANPDLTLTMPAYTVKASADEYRNFAMDSKQASTSYITQMEVLPGNSSIVHHVLVFMDSTNTSLQADAADPDPGYQNFGGTPNLKLIGAWVPGAQPLMFPAGTGLRLPAGSTVVMQIHYPKGSKGMQDSTTVRFKMTATQQREVTISPDLYHTAPSLQNGPLFIPANTTKTFKERASVPRDLTLLAVAPHMHLLGKNMKVYAVVPVTKDTIPLINIPDWDFHWQGMYFFKKAIKIPKGSAVWAEALYDNTTANPRNPNNPPADVSLGEATTDEMMLVYMARMLYVTGDENIRMDSSGSTSISQPPLSAVFSLNPWPNPAGTEINVSLGSHSAATITLYNLSGNVVHTQTASGSDAILSIGTLPAGVYLIKATADGSIRYGRFVKD